MDILDKLAVRIIQEQEGIVGPIALEQARKVPGIKVDWVLKEVELDGDKKNIVNRLVEQYKSLFGQASVEVCKEAAKDYINEIPPQQRPALLA